MWEITKGPWIVRGSSSQEPLKDEWGWERLCPGDTERCSWSSDSYQREEEEEEEEEDEDEEEEEEDEEEDEEEGKLW